MICFESFSKKSKLYYLLLWCPRICEFLRGKNLNVIGGIIRNCMNICISNQKMSRVVHFLVMITLQKWQKTGAFCFETSTWMTLRHEITFPYDKHLSLLEMLGSYNNKKIQTASEFGHGTLKTCQEMPSLL